MQTDDLSGRLATIADPEGVASEAYRVLRTNLFYAHLDTPPQVIVVISHGPHEGKSTVCANLGVVLAQAEKEVLLFDCDFRHPVLHKMFQLRHDRGIGEVLVGNRSFRDTVQQPMRNLKVMPVGSLPPSPAELVSSHRFAEFLAQVRQEFDYVLIDAPPIGAISYSLALAAEGDGVLLVLDAQSTRKSAVRQAMRRLEGVGANVLGTVMNNVQDSNIQTYQGY